MTTKKLYEMTPEEQKALTKDELEEKVFEMAIEGMNDRGKYVYITAREKEKSLPESLKPFKFARFFFCDLYEGARAVEQIRAAAAKPSGTIQDIYYSAIDTILDYATYYADLCNHDAEQIAQDLIAFVKNLVFLQYDKEGEQGEGVLIAYPGDEQDSVKGSFYGFAIFQDKTPPTSPFEIAYSLLTAASEIALHALLEVKAPRETFTAVYSAFVETITRTIPAPENVKDYTERNARFDKMFEELKAPENKSNEPLFTEIDGQQVIKEAYPTISKAVELVPRTAISDVFRRGGIPKTAFNLKYSPALYQGDGFAAAIEKVEELKNSLSDRADKLLTSIENAYITTHPSDNIVYIDFFDFCDKCKYNTSKRENIKVAKTNIRNDLNDIALPTFTADGAHGDFVNVKFIGSHGVITPKKGDPYIMCAVDPVYAKMMNRGQLTRYPRTVYQYTGTPYNIVKKLYEHYCMDSNVKRGTNVILSVKSILAASGLKETPRTQKLWRSELKERLENALDVLKAGGDLKDWKYCKAKKEPLTEQEAQDIINSTYGNYKGLYITFELEQLPDDTERLIKNEQRREELEDKKARAALKAAETVIKNEEKKKKKRAARGKGEPTKG